MDTSSNRQKPQERSSFLRHVAKRDTDLSQHSLSLFDRLFVLQLLAIFLLEHRTINSRRRIIESSARVVICGVHFAPQITTLSQVIYALLKYYICIWTIQFFHGTILGSSANRHGTHSKPTIILLHVDFCSLLIVGGPCQSLRSYLRRTNKLGKLQRDPQRQYLGWKLCDTHERRSSVILCREYYIVWRVSEALITRQLYGNLWCERIWVLRCVC